MTWINSTLRPRKHAQRLAEEALLRPCHMTEPPRTCAARPTALAGLLLVGGGFLVAYRSVILKLVHAWATDDNYSHGFLIVPIALYLAWERRRIFLAAPSKPAGAGMLVIVASVCLLVAGVIGAELFLTRISMIVTIAGIILYLAGWKRLRVVAFPIALLLLMVPLPAIIFNQVAFPLQLLASRCGEQALAMLDIPVLREGNVLVLPNVSLEVAEACSGIRSLTSLLTLGIVFGYLADSRPWVRSAIALSAVPVAIFTNAARVAGTGIAARYYGPAAAEGFLHEFSGWAMFLLAFVVMLLLQRSIAWLTPEHSVFGPAVEAV